MKKIKYYDIRSDVSKYPDAWCYLAWSKRGPGKTYSTLRMMIEDKKKFLFIKRTIKDIQMLCSTKNGKGFKFDISPFVPLNRDFGWNIIPVKIMEGIAGFYNCNEEGRPVGDPVGYAGALSAAKDIKGFDMSECDYVIFDEFIPKRYERINRKEGEQLLDIYMTVSRDRKIRGRGELKLICIANATSVNNPVFITLDVVNVAVNMDVTNTEYTYLDNKKIMLHFIPAVKEEKENLSGIELAMLGTEWGDMAFSGHFAFDDFTAVKHQRLKGFTPICSCEYQRKMIYIYGKDGYYYATSAKASKKVPHYNLARENDQKRFWFDFVSSLRDECINDRFTFEQYTMYDLIINYKKIFQI